MTAEIAQVRNPHAEVAALVGPALYPHVLEPSPPAITEEPFADDPVAAGATPSLVPAGISRVGASPWASWVEDNPEHQAWLAERWLTPGRRLGPIPPTLTTTRLALHRLAAYVIAPVRHQTNGKFGLRWTLGGFGTPYFGDDRQIRVEGTTLVDQRGDHVRSAPITTLQAAADLLETTIDTETAAEHDSPAVGDLSEQLAVDAAAASFLGDWYGMAFAALEQVRADDGSIDASLPQLWPGHFDPAIEIGDEDHRGSYGASPGDESIAEPYLYVSIWWPDRVAIDASDSTWNAPSFTGAVLRLADFDDGDPVEQSASFFRSIRDLIAQ